MTTHLREPKQQPSREKTGEGTGRGRTRQGRAGQRAEWTHVVFGDGLPVEVRLDAIGHEAEKGPGPQEGGEATEQVFAEQDPLGDGGRRGQCVGSVAGQGLPGLFGAEALRGEANCEAPGGAWGPGAFRGACTGCPSSSSLGGRGSVPAWRGVWFGIPPRTPVPWQDTWAPGLRSSDRMGTLCKVGTRGEAHGTMVPMRPSGPWALLTL